MNKLYQQLQPQQQTIQKSLPSLKSNLELLQKTLQNSDPNSFIQNIILNNPKMKNAMQLFNASKMTPKQFFYYFAQQKGVDPDQFLNS